MKKLSNTLTALLLVALLPIASLYGQEGPVVEVKVIPGAPTVQFRCQVQAGKSVLINWGDGMSERFSEEELSLVSHSYDFGAPEGAQVTIEGAFVTALEEPSSREGLSNIAGWGEIHAPELTHFVFVKPRISMMSFSPTLDFSKCPKLKTLRLHDVNEIILPRPSVLEELEVRGAWNTTDPNLFLAKTLDLSQSDKLHTLKLRTQIEVEEIDLTGCTALRVIDVRSCPKLSKLTGIKGLTNIEECVVKSNALTFDQLPVWTEKLKESETSYSQSKDLWLPETLISKNVVDLSFIHRVADKDGKEHISTIQAVLLNDIPLDSTTYSYADDGKLTFKKEAFAQEADGEQIYLASIDVRIVPANEYYPNYGTEEYDPSFAVTISNPFLSNVERHRVTYSAGEGGTVEAHIVDNNKTPLPSGSEVDEGTEIRLLAKPNRKYLVDTWKVNGEIVAATGAQNEELVTRILGETSIEVTFKKKIETFSVTYEAGEHGSLTAENAADQSTIHSGDGVPEGTTVTFRAVADSGYEVESWEVNGITSPIVSETLTETVNESLLVRVSFKPVYKTLTFSCNGEGGTLTAYAPERVQSLRSGDAVPVGTRVRLTATPKDEWQVSYWQINGQKFDEGKNRLEYNLTIEDETSVVVLFADHSSVDPITADQHQISISDGKLLIEGLEASEIISIYDATGALLLRQSAEQGAILLSDLNCEGALIVSFAGKSYKVLYFK